ncbi:MAG: hypothetical protein QNL33_04275 [Akkermansiaceae bacterium]
MKLNPDAHFGREKYQLQAIQWLQHETLDEYFKFPPGFRESDGPNFRINALDPRDRDAVKGWSGLIELGAAWESVDIYRALALALLRVRAGGLAHVTLMRVRELEPEGKSSSHPTFLNFPKNPGPLVSSTHHQKEQMEMWFLPARKNSEARHRERTEYLLTRLNKGQHPDTHPDFWKDWKEPDFPEMTSRPF